MRRPKDLIIEGFVFQTIRDDILCIEVNCIETDFYLKEAERLHKWLGQHIKFAKRKKKQTSTGEDVNE